MTATDYQIRDFVETAEGLIFALVAPGQEAGRLLASLRYQRGDDGVCRKLASAQAERLLESRYPDYLYYSPRRDVRLHAVPLPRVVRHHQPSRRAEQLCSQARADAIEARARDLLLQLMSEGVAAEALGVTGSLLIGAQTLNSDIDVVVYGRGNFFHARQALRRLLEKGAVQCLSPALWREAYTRRGCDLDFEEFLWHEQRKFNKAAIAGSKFDLTLVAEAAFSVCEGVAVKQGPARIRARILDDDLRFDFPARWRIEHPLVTELLSFTATYAGQALKGETVEAAGMIETSADGVRRLVVGSSREAPGEYVRVLREP